MFFNTPTTSYGIIGITIGLLGGILFTVAKLRVSTHIYTYTFTYMHTMIVNVESMSNNIQVTVTISCK